MKPYNNNNNKKKECFLSAIMWISKKIQIFLSLLAKATSDFKNRISLQIKNWKMFCLKMENWLQYYLILIYISCSSTLELVKEWLLVARIYLILESTMTLILPDQKTRNEIYDIAIDAFKVLYF